MYHKAKQDVYKRQTVFREDTTLYAQWAVTGELTHAQAPVIDWVTKAVKAEVGDISNGLYVDAVSPDGGTLLYRWYRSDTASNENGTPIAVSYTHLDVYKRQEPSSWWRMSG